MQLASDVLQLLVDAGPAKSCGLLEGAQSANTRMSRNHLPDRLLQLPGTILDVRSQGAGLHRHFLSAFYPEDHLIEHEDFP